MTRLFLLPFLGHFGLVCGLYVWLTIERQRAVGRGEVVIGDFVHAGSDRGRAERVQRNLTNQFELPVFALFAALLLVTWKVVSLVDVVAAWAFLFGRIVHTAVQTLTDNVTLRGQVFTITFLAVAALMARVGWIVITS